MPETHVVLDLFRKNLQDAVAHIVPVGIIEEFKFVQIQIIKAETAVPLDKFGQFSNRPMIEQAGQGILVGHVFQLPTDAA